VAFERRGEKAIGFRLGAYDPTQPLVIDPLVYSSFIGPLVPQALVVDGAGAAYVVGRTQSTAFPTTEPSLQPGFAGGVCLVLGFGPAPSYSHPCDDIVVAKMNPDGTALEYATYLGGPGSDVGVDIAVDALGNAYVLARAAAGLPTTEGVLQPESTRGARPAYIAKLDPTGQNLVLASYLAGSGGESPRAIAVDLTGNIYVTGTTVSMDFPTTSGALQPHWPGRDSLESNAFVAKLNPEATELVYSTYLGGFLDDRAFDIEVDSEGHAYVAGRTESMDFPATPGVLQAIFPDNAQQAGFVAKLSTQGDALVYSTFLRSGGSAMALAVDAGGHAYVAGTVASEDFPFTPGALRTDSRGFLAKLAADASELVYAAEVGGSNRALAVDAAGHAYLAGVAGTEFGGHFEPTAGALQPCGSSGNGFAAKVSADGGELLYGTFVDLGSESVTAIDVGTDGSIFMAGFSDLRWFPLMPDAFQDEPITEEKNGFLAKIRPAPGSHFLASQVRNSASYLQGGVAPGEWITLFNPGIGPETPETPPIRPEGRGVTELGGVRVLFDGVAGYLTYAHRCQINAIVPFEVAGRNSVEIRVEYLDAALDPVTVPVVEASPGLYSQSASGRGAAAALNQDLTVNGQQPARPGSFVALFGTGAGLMDPPLEDGLPAAPPFSSVRLPVAVLYMDPTTEEFREAVVTYAGAAPELLAGMLQVNFQVPPDIQFRQQVLPGAHQLPIRLRVGDQESQTVFVWVDQ
jgi:uncharacterized protein (TIGR03437 family)